MDLATIYEKHSKALLLLPLALFFVFGFLAVQVPLGIELKGGTLVTIQLESDAPIEGLDSSLRTEFGLESVEASKVSSPLGTGIVLKFADHEGLSSASKALEGAEKLSVEEQRTAVAQAMNFLKELLSESRVQSLLREVEASPAPLDYGFEALAEARISFNDSLTAHLREKISSEFKSVSFTTIGPSLGEAFLLQATYAVATAIVLLLAVVLFFFRKLVPSLAIVLAATFDMLTALAGMTVFHIPVTLASISALLMMVGYSVDANVLLTSRVLNRREETPAKRAASSMRTGLSMMGTTFFAVGVLLAVAYMSQMQVVVEISSVLLLGLAGDVVFTWLMNAPMLLLYLDFKAKNPHVKW